MDLGQTCMCLCIRESWLLHVLCQELSWNGWTAPTAVHAYTRYPGPSSMHNAHAGQSFYITNQGDKIYILKTIQFFTLYCTNILT